MRNIRLFVYFSNTVLFTLISISHVRKIEKKFSVPWRRVPQKMTLTKKKFIWKVISESFLIANSELLKGL